MSGQTVCAVGSPSPIEGTALRGGSAPNSPHLSALVSVSCMRRVCPICSLSVGFVEGRCFSCFFLSDHWKHRGGLPKTFEKTLVLFFSCQVTWGSEIIKKTHEFLFLRVGSRKGPSRNALRNIALFLVESVVSFLCVFEPRSFLKKLPGVACAMDSLGRARSPRFSLIYLAKRFCDLYMIRNPRNCG